jgi:hypothetical protein
MACKYKYNNNWYSKEELQSILYKEKGIDKYGKLVKPEISQPKTEKITLYRVKGEPEYFNTREEAQQLANKLSQIDYMSTYVVETINVDRVAKQTGIQPTQTISTLKESIDSVKRKANLLTTEYGEIDINEETLIQAEDSLNSLQKAKILFNDDSVNEYLVPNNKWFVKLEVNYPSAGFDTKKQAEDYLKDEIIKADNFVKQLKSKPKKEYTDQALINTKIAALKEVAKKYPRSLIRSEVKKINTSSSSELYDQFGDELPFQKIPSAISQINNYKPNILQVEDSSLKQNNLQEGLQWLKQIMPDVDPILVDGLIDSIANGSYNILEDLITLSKDYANKNVIDSFKRKMEGIDVNLYSQYLEQNPNGSVEQFKSWVEEFNKNNKLLQESGSLTTISKSKIDNLQSTVEYQLLNEKDEDLDKKIGQSYMFLSEKDAQIFTYLVERNKEFPEEFKVTKKITKYEKDSKNPLKLNGYNEYVDFYYIKSNKNKKSNLYDIINKETGEVIASKVRVLSVSKDSKSEIAKKYGLEHTPTKVFNANRSIAFALYRQKPSKAKYIAQAKKYLYDAIKFLNPEETNLKINLNKIEELLSSFPEEMWDYINTTYSPEDSTNINASISLQNEIKFNLPKLGFIQEIEKITGIPLQGVSFKNYDRSGFLAKVFKYSKLNGGWGNTITIDNSMTTKELQASIRYYLSTKNVFKSTTEEENVRKYAEHRRIDYDKLKELVFGDIDKALDNIAYNNTGNSDTIELSKWRESIRNYDWQSVELFSKPYENFQNTVKERIITKFKDKNLSNGISHLEYFFNSGSFNWLNINFNNISGQYYLSDMETEANVGVKTKMGGIINPFEMKIYQKPKAGENFLQEKEIFNRLAAVLHEPFHALHALSYGTKEELELRKAFDNLYRTEFGKEMMNQVFGSGYNNQQQISYDTLYKEFTAFTTQLMLYPKQWIKNTDLRSNDIYEFIEKIQTLQDKTYEEIVKTQQKIGTIEKTITEEEQIKLSFLEKLYNYLVKALNKIIPLSKKFTNLIVDSKLVEKKVIEDVFGEVEETVTKTLKLPDNVKKSKEQFLEAMKELQSAINTLMQIDGKLFSSENITNFFTSNKFNQEQGSLSDYTSQKSQENNSFQQFQQSLNKPNTNPILQGNQTNIEEIITQLEKDGLLEIDCKGKLKAEKGLSTSFTKGGKWKLVKDLKDYPTHKEGGVDLTIGKNGVSIKNSNTEFTAKHGLVIPKN